MKKNFKKKCLAWVTAVVMALSIIPIVNMSGVVSATGTETTVTVDNIEYKISNGEATVKSGAAASGAVVIPDTIQDDDGTDYKVVAIENRAFYQNSKITSVTLGDNVTSIGMYAFTSCKGLTDVKNGSNVKSVSYEAFMYCTNLENVEIGENITSIGAAAFEYCESLADVPFGDKVELIGGVAFDGCKALEKIVLSDSLTQVGDNAFSSCENLTDVTIGNGLTVISQWMFSGCSKLTEIIIPQGVTTIGASAFANCTSLKNVDIPQSVTMIGSNAFTGCTSLEEVKIFNSTLTLSYNEDVDKERDVKVFDQCNNLTSIYIPCNADVATMFGSDSGITLGEDDGYTTADGSTSGKFYRMHNIVYTASNQAISALCSVNNENLGSVTIVAPTELEYTGEPILATLSGKITASGVSTPTIKYAAADGSTLTDGKPVEPGTYTASITMGGKTVSVEYTISGNSYGSDDDYDSSDNDTSVSTDTASSSSAQVLNVASDNVVASDAPVEDVTLENSTEELLGASIFTAAEKRQIANGSSAKVYVGIDSLPAENVPQADRNAIESEATASLGTNFAIQYMDMSLFKQIGNSASQKVSEPGVGIKVTVELPSNLINRNAGVSRRYVVIRLHNGVVTTLETTFDSATNKLAFSTDRFSTYAIAYTDEAVATGNLTAASPKTGDSANIHAMLALMAVAGMMLCLARMARPVRLKK